MKNTLICCLAALGMLCGSAAAQDDVGAKRFADARAAVEDLQRIVAPHGVQDSYKTRIGGIEQWINVRGQDRAIR